MESYKKTYSLKNGQEVTIRTPEEEDAQGLIDLMQIVDCETRFLAREPGEFKATLEEEKCFIKHRLSDDSGQFLIAEIHGEIIGSCSVGIVMGYQRFQHRASLGIVVKKDFWRWGIGKILLSSVIDWCKKRGVEQLELDVIVDNKRGIGLYESFGFKVFGTKKNALKYADGTYGDEYFMILFLGE